MLRPRHLGHCHNMRCAFVSGRARKRSPGRLTPAIEATLGSDGNAPLGLRLTRAHPNGCWSLYLHVRRAVAGAFTGLCAPAC